MLKLTVLAIAVIIYLLAIVLAVATYADTSAANGSFRRLVLRLLPFGIAVGAPLLLANEADVLSSIVLEMILYLLLTWIMVWAVKKQWYG